MHYFPDVLLSGRFEIAHKREPHEWSSKSCHQVVIISIRYAANHSEQSKHTERFHLVKYYNNIEAYSGYVLGSVLQCQP